MNAPVTYGDIACPDPAGGPLPVECIPPTCAQGTGQLLINTTTTVITFWMVKQATPGKMAVSTRIVDADSGNAASAAQLIGRYFAYFAACIPLGLGILWVAFDRRKQGWHDKLAGTVVVRQT